LNFIHNTFQQSNLSQDLIASIIISNDGLLFKEVFLYSDKPFERTHETILYKYLGLIVYY